MRFAAFRYVTENRIISKDEKERMFLEIKENKSCIFNPMGVCGFHGVLLFLTIESILSKGFYCRFCVSSGGMYSIKSVRLHSNT